MKVSEQVKVLEDELTDVRNKLTEAQKKIINYELRFDEWKKEIRKKTARAERFEAKNNQLLDAVKRYKPTHSGLETFYNNTFIGGDTVVKPCLWDSVSEEDKKKPMMLSCGCPKCGISC